MAFTVEEFRDLVQLLEAQPAWRAELRRLVLTDELLTLPELVRTLAVAHQRLGDQVAALADAQRRTEERLGSLETHMAALADAQRRTEEGVRALTTDVGELKGDSLERRYRERAFAYFAPLLRRIRVLSGDDLAALLEGALRRGQLSEDEAEEITWADLVIRGRRREDDAQVYLVVEVSWGLEPPDVERATERAALLGRTGLLTMPVVAGKTVSAEAASLARTLRVWQVTDGRVVPPA